MKRNNFIKNISPKNVYLFFIIFLITGCGEQKIDQATIRNDIDFITKTITENHPGPHNTLDPEFMTLLASAHQEALKNAATVTTMREYNTLIKTYMDRFHDGHLRFGPKNPTEKRTVQKTSHDITIKNFTDNTVLITIPTFDPNSEQKKQFKKLTDQLPTLRNKETIIFDVRGNTGGNSAWATHIIEALFGEYFAKKKIRQKEQKIFIDWRASKENTDYQCSIAKEICEDFGEKSAAALEGKSICNGMQKSLQQKEIFFRQYDQQEDQEKIPNQEDQCSAKIVVLIDKACFSATLHFIDDLKALGHALSLVGKTTGADALYIDVRVVNLPSGFGRIQFPMKVYRNRPRGNNEPYRPDIEYPGDMTNTPALEQWLIQNVISQNSLSKK
jgi:hypothetical protein